MKTIVTFIALVALSLSGYAQTKPGLTDDLVPDKDKALAKYLPMHNGTYLHKLYIMPVAEVEQQLRAYREAMEPEIAKQKTPALQELARG